MWPTMQTQVGRFKELEAQLADPEIASNHSKYRAVAKEHGALAKRVKPYFEYEKITSEVESARQMFEAETDPEMKVYAEEELKRLLDKQLQLKNQIEDDLLFDPSEDFESLIVEIRAGTGGDEAALFAGDLYEMYSRYARTKGWKLESIDFSEGEMGGFKEVVFSVSGEDVYRKLRYESGGHRVQRVPKTETQGRIHTSAATVAVLPEPDDSTVEIKDSDIEWERMRAGGAGGQHVNKTESAVRIWYKKGTPDELEVKCQDGRSQTKNYEQAMRILRSRVFERHQQKVAKERADARKNQIGSGDRSDRIRTYNFPQNRLTDHRINLNLYKLDMIMMGELEELISAAQEYDKKQRLGQL
ncbi:peptide chain release factor 1 [Telmatocola sphagniphila]|uniref:Peptide chain release factor 1 n=1 Tax=Telmatocola sphagniphila TaxID=1123043 RepID=A0A8E6BCP1_9BACT|nr:peptide chain release factor 1 [Telmatocola sphagniphila]QVL34758.1 peptide chain release factor 1 [Telmatocola sphagniphila]